MQFETVSKDHIIQAAFIFDEQGPPKGFGESIGYDVIINGTSYPPKAIMAYANEIAEGVPPTNYFGGGKNEASFKAFELLGYSLICEG